MQLKRKHYLSICAVIRNEAPYIVEWLNYHIRQGVSHFYLYDNASTDGTKEAAKEYDFYITWHDTKGDKQQCKSYAHMIETYREESTWCAFIDIDEFIYSKRTPKFITTLKEEYDYPEVSGIAVHWLLFGSNSHLHFSSDPVIKRFTRRASTVNKHVKSIMRLEDTIAPGNDPHSFLATGLIINEHKIRLEKHYAISNYATADILGINHYVTKSREEHDKRRAMPDANSGRYKPIEEHFTAHDCNDIEDLTLFKREGYE